MPLKSAFKRNEVQYWENCLKQLSGSEQEKVALEHQAAKIFMRCYERDSGHEIRHLWHNKPRKPDVSCKLDGQRLDLEIAHLYGTELEAKQILGRHLDDETCAELRELTAHTEPEARLVKALNRILLNKSGKYYRSERVWLVIRNAHPAWDRAQIEALQHKIDVPPAHPFEQIWMVGDWEGKSGIIKLFP